MTSADSTPAGEPKAVPPAQPQGTFHALIAVVLAAGLAFYLGVRTGRRMEVASPEHPTQVGDGSGAGIDGTEPLSAPSTPKAGPPSGTVYRDIFRDLPPRKADQLKGLDVQIQAAMKAWEVPGVAVAVVKDDAVVYSKGFGVRKLGGYDTVDPHTLFGIASVSKGFTTALAAMLVDEGKISWDDPLARHLPDLELHEPLSARDVTLRDVFCHRVGLPRADSLWAGSSNSREQVLKGLAGVRPKAPFRSQFGYQNGLYLAAGEALAHAGGSKWEELIRTRIFVPLEMKESHASTAILIDPKGGNVASGHDTREGRLVAIAAQNYDNCAPATGIVSSAADMAQWVRFLLGPGSRGDQSLIYSATMPVLFEPQILMPESDFLSKSFPEKTFSAYALGWIVQDYRNHRVIVHPGNANGTRALVALMPDQRLGVVVLANRELSPLPMAVMYDVFDAYLGRPPADRVAARGRALKDLADARPLAERGQRLFREGKVPDALASLDQAILRDPLDPLFYHSRGAIRAASHDFPGAIADYTAALRLDPRAPKIYADRALARVNRGDARGAIGDATRAIQIDPDLAAAYNNRALALKTLGESPEEAIADATRAIELDPKAGGAYAVRGLLRLKLGQDREAEEDFAAAAKVQPGLAVPIEREARQIRANRK